MSKIIHQHIPKAASSSTVAFFPGCIRYGRDTLNQDIPDDDDIISFTIIRDPLERFLSCLRMFMGSGLCTYSQDEVVDVCLTHDFDNAKLKTGMSWTETDASIALHSLSIFHPFLNVFDENGNLKAAHLIRFDNMTKELAAIIPRDDYERFPWGNKSPNLKVSLTPSQLARFREKFAKDIAFYERVR